MVGASLGQDFNARLAPFLVAMGHKTRRIRAPLYLSDYFAPWIATSCSRWPPTSQSLVSRTLLRAVSLRFGVVQFQARADP
ncbi:MAG: hypothetical protein CL858_17395 [Cupriavidus sp.]|jgi:hypothetical protein|nr:hypothetical protein [Cupriavidus sp.]MBU67208.1 hypothetical protein [Cupriavidus sp.]